MTRPHGKILNKNYRIRLRPKNSSGIILIVVLWILVILSLLAIGFSRKVNVNLALTKYAIGKMRSRYIAMAGLMYAIDQIKQDSEDAKTNILDTKYQCGFSLQENQTVENLFKKKGVGGGSFTIGYSLLDQDRKTHYGLEDEESKVNLNGLNTGNYKILQYLLDELGFENSSVTIASSVVDWLDADKEVFNIVGAEDEEYQSRGIPYQSKNKPFDNLEELLLVKGMTPEIFKRIRDYITVFPRQDNMAINLDTASEVVLKALARSITGQTNTAIEDTDRLVERLVTYRRGEDGLWGTSDDRVIDGNTMGLNAVENTIFQAMSYSRTRTSRFLRIHVKGIDEASLASTDIETVVDRGDLSFMYWHRDS